MSKYAIGWKEDAPIQGFYRNRGDRLDNSKLQDKIIVDTRADMDELWAAVRRWKKKGKNRAKKVYVRVYDCDYEFEEPV